jgi:hypothetical protein
MRDWVWAALGGREIEMSIYRCFLGVLFFGAIVGIGYYTNENWLPAAPVGVLVIPSFILVVELVDDRFRHLFPRLSDGVTAVLVIGSATLFGYFDIPERVAGALGVSEPALNGFILGVLVGIILLLAIRIGLSVRRSGLATGWGERFTR